MIFILHILYRKFCVVEMYDDTEKCVRYDSENALIQWFGRQCFREYRGSDDFCTLERVGERRFYFGIDSDSDVLRCMRGQCYAMVDESSGVSYNSL